MLFTFREESSETFETRMQSRQDVCIFICLYDIYIYICLLTPKPSQSKKKKNHRYVPCFEPFGGRAIASFKGLPKKQWSQKNPTSSVVLQQWRHSVPHATRISSVKTASPQGDPTQSSVPTLASLSCTSLAAALTGLGLPSYTT